MDLKRVVLEGTDEELATTDRSQLAITLVSLSAAIVLRERGVSPEGCAGFSLGEYAALGEAGVLAVDDLFRVVKLRGELMERASRDLDGAGGRPGMAAVLGMAPARVQEVVQGIEGLFLANQNSPVQVVLSGTAPALAAAEELLKKEGVRRIVRLKVSGPFHSPLMGGARRIFAEALAEVRFSDPRLPVYSNATALVIGSASEARELCARQLVSPVRWVDEERRLLADGYDRFLEVGPGTVLTGLLKAVLPDADCAPAGRLEEIVVAAGR